MNESVPDSGLYDWTQAEVLFGPQTEPVPQDMVELVADMVSSVTQRLEGFLHCSEEQLASEETSQQFHQIRGNLLNFGFIGVAGQIKNLEFPARSLTAEDYRRQLQNVQSTFRANLHALGQAYPNLQPALSL